MTVILHSVPQTGKAAATGADIPGFSWKQPKSSLKEGFTQLQDHANLDSDKTDKAMALFTLGYEGLAIGDFIARLNDAGVHVVFDIRQMPLSRKKGFSKSSFSAALREAGIGYFHLPIFGCPRPIRDQYRLDGNWDRYEKAFKSYLTEKSEAVSQLASVTNFTSACLVCFEADFNFCHRSLVAEATAAAGGPKVTHLKAKTASPDLACRVAA